MRVITALALGSACLAVASCRDIAVPDYNNSSLEDLTSNPTPAKVASAAQGLLIGARVQAGLQNGYVSLLGILGRESYNLDPADPRFITEMLISGLDGGSPAFGGNLFAFPYRNIRAANILLDALDIVPVMSEAQKEAVRGFTKTIQAYDYLRIVNTRDNLGAPIDVRGAPTGEPAPIVAKATVLSHIAVLLDEGHAHLQAGGSAFPFTPSPGFASFDTPARFATFNRALKAQVEAYRQEYASALTALASSFIDPGAPLTLGAYHSFSTASGDIQNLLFDPTGRAVVAHQSIVTDAQLRPDASPDARTSKVAPIPVPRTVQDISAEYVFTLYQSNTTPIPIIRNEELILLRAEARYFTGDLVGALNDINFIRTASGGLAPRGPFLSEADFVAELLYQRRYSLLFEGGHRWIDARRFGLLATLPRALPEHRVFGRFPFPEAECLARVPAPAQGCTPQEN